MRAHHVKLARHGLRRSHRGGRLKVGQRRPGRPLARAHGIAEGAADAAQAGRVLPQGEEVGDEGEGVPAHLRQASGR